MVGLGDAREGVVESDVAIGLALQLLAIFHHQIIMPTDVGHFFFSLRMLEIAGART